MKWVTWALVFLPVTIVLILGGQWGLDRAEEMAKADQVSQAYKQVALDQRDIMARRNLVWALRVSGRADEEFIQLRDVYYGFPDQIDLVYNYGAKCYERGDYRQAEKVLTNVKSVGVLEEQRKSMLAACCASRQLPTDTGGALAH